MVFVLAFLLMGLIMAGMAIGAIAGRGPLKGSCGGLSAVGIEGRCDICGEDPSLRRKEQEQGAESAEAHANAWKTPYYDASK